MNARAVARLAGAGLLAAAAVLLAVVLAPRAAFAQDLVVEVGYNGEGDKFYEKRTFSEDEIKALSADKIYEYATIDKAGGLQKGFGRGATVEAILRAAGVDPNTLVAVNFRTQDDYTQGGAFTQWGKKALFDEARYYYPQYINYADFNNPGYFLPADPNAIAAGAERVPAIIAYESSFLRITSATDSNWTNSGQMDSNRGYRVMMGNSSVTEVAAGAFAHSIVRLQCILPGHPELTFDKTSIAGEVGDVVEVHASINADDSAISTQGLKDITWSVSGTDENGLPVAEIAGSDPDGTVRLRILSKGQIVLSGTFGSYTGKVGGVGMETPDPPNPDPDPDGSLPPEENPDPSGDSSDDGSGGTGGGGGWNTSGEHGSGTDPDGTSSLPKGARLMYSSSWGAADIGGAEEQAAPALQETVGLGGIAGEEVDPTILNSDAIEVAVTSSMRYGAAVGVLVLVGFITRVTRFQRAKDGYVKLRRSGPPARRRTP